MGKSSKRLRGKKKRKKSMVLPIVENIGNVGVTGNGVTWW